MKNDAIPSILESFYDPTLEEMQYKDLTINISTLLYDRLHTACRKTNLSVDSFLSVSIVRALFDYEQYSNTVSDEN